MGCKNIFVHILFLILLCPVTLFSAEEIPFFSKGTLFIPVIDTSTRPGKYQNVMFEYSDLDGWQLTGLREGFYRAIDEIEILYIDAFPVQIIMNIRGTGSSCGKVGPVRYKVTDNVIELFVYSLISKEIKVCTANVVDFSEYFSLPVYGLDAGIYEIIINEEFTDSFVLEEDNYF